MLAEAAEAAVCAAPDAYAVLGNGTMNAFAAGHGFRRYICLYLTCSRFKSLRP